MLSGTGSRERSSKVRMWTYAWVREDGREGGLTANAGPVAGSAECYERDLCERRQNVNERNLRFQGAKAGRQSFLSDISHSLNHRPSFIDPLQALLICFRSHKSLS
jgi:hypothetical protein